MGVCSWRSRRIISIIPALPSTVTRYIRRNSMKRIDWISSESVNPRKMKSCTGVLFFLSIVFNFCQLWRNQIWYLAGMTSQRFVFMWTTWHLISLVFLKIEDNEWFVDHDWKKINLIAKYKNRHNLAFEYNIIKVNILNN